MTNSKKKVMSAALAAICVLSAGACGKRETPAQQDQQQADVNTTPAATIASEDVQELLANEEEVEKLENPTVKFLANWDINPEAGKPKTPTLEMFEQLYGGKIETTIVGWDNRYTRLGELVSTGDSPDMFSAMDNDTFPMGLISGMFEPLDDYIDFDSDDWAYIKNVNDMFSYNGKHYVGAYDTEVEGILIFNKKTFTENDIKTPNEYMKEGNWTWDTFYDTMVKFCNPADEKYAIDGWWYESAFSLTTGVPYIGIENNKLVSNFDNDLIGKVQAYFLKIHDENLPVPKANYDWTVHPERVGQGKTLYYPCGLWLLQGSVQETDENGNVTKYVMDVIADEGQVGIAPMPKCPDADAWYLPARPYGFTLVSGAKNPKGVAAYVDCARRCRDNAKAKEIDEKSFKEDYHWTDEMLNDLEEIRKLTREHPMFEFYQSATTKLNDLVNNPIKETYNNGTAWASTKDSYKVMIQKELDGINKDIEAQNG